MTTTANVTNHEIAQRGEALYQTLRERLETQENIGRLVVLDVDSGDYEIAEEGLVAGKRLLERHPNAAMLCLRIGYDAVYALGGSSLTRMKQ